MIKARYFSFEPKPRAIYYLTDIRSDIYPNHSVEDFYKEVKEKWVSNPDVVVVDDRDAVYSSGQIEMNQIEKYINKIEELKKELESDEDQ